MGPNLITLTFASEADAKVFQLWWSNNGREQFEDDLAAIVAEHPGFNGNHVLQGPGGSEPITYTAEP